MIAEDVSLVDASQTEPAQEHKAGANREFTITVKDGTDDEFHWALAESQGRRPGMEDAHTVLLDLEERGPEAGSARTALFGVFDGHNGREVAAFVARRLPALLLQSEGYRMGDMCSALHQAFLATDAQLADPVHQAELFALHQHVPVPDLPAPAAQAAAASASPAAMSTPPVESDGAVAATAAAKEGEVAKAQAWAAGLSARSGAAEPAGSASTALPAVLETSSITAPLHDHHGCPSTLDTTTTTTASATTTAAPLTGTAPAVTQPGPQPHGLAADVDQGGSSSTAPSPALMATLGSGMGLGPACGLDPGPPASLPPSQLQLQTRTPVIPALKRLTATQHGPAAEGSAVSLTSSAEGTVTPGAKIYTTSAACMEDAILRHVGSSRCSSADTLGTASAFLMVAASSSQPSNPYSSQGALSSHTVVGSPPTSLGAAQLQRLGLLASEQHDLVLGRASNSATPACGSQGSGTGKASAKQSLDGADAAKAEMGVKDQLTSGVGGDAASGLDAGDGEGGGASVVHQRAREVAAALPPQVLQQAAGYGAFNAAGQYLGSKAGSTAVVAVVHERTLYVASAGDSRCVLSRGGQARQLTEDHKPAQPKEATRIYTAGSFVAPSRHGGVLRVGGSLAMSRAIGDHRFKGNPCLPPEAQAVTATPDVQAVNLGGAHDFMVLACDGVWDVMTSDQVVAAVHQGLEACLPPAKVVQELVARCLQGSQLPGASSDNITILLVVFLAQLQQQGGQQQGQQQGQ